MAFNRTTRCNGQIELSNGIAVNVDFEYVDSNNEPPKSANFNFQISSETSDDPKLNTIWVNGNFNVTDGVINNYNVSSGIVPDEIMNELATQLVRIKTEYKTI